MGQTLSSPATEKVSQSGGNKKFLYAVTEMQGWRITMEDSHSVLLNLDQGQDDSNAFFAVYDGHGGGTVAKYAGQNVHKRLVKEETYQSRSYEAALKNAFLGTDEDIRADPAHTKDPSGCTAVAALVTTDGRLYVANAGDSRSVISVKGEVKPLSFDHKPSNKVEMDRITGAGGYVDCGRVNGNLALSRAIGDFEFKKNYDLIPEKQIITSDPDVTEHEITEDDEFFILACDGIWDCLSSQQVVDFVRRKVYEGKELPEINAMLFEHCLAPDTDGGVGIGCDNMTALVVAILHGRTKEEWYAWMRNRVETGYGYETPDEPRQIYSLFRRKNFLERQAGIAERERARNEREKKGGSSSGLISFIGGGERSTTLTFGVDDSDEDIEDDDDLGGKKPFLGDTLGIGSDSPDATMNLKAQLEEFERDNQDDSGINDTSEEPADGSSTHGQPLPPPHPESPPTVDTRTAETPSSPLPLPNGDANTLVEQLKSQPAGDEPSPALKAEGYLDSSEDPLLNVPA